MNVQDKKDLFIKEYRKIRKLLTTNFDAESKYSIKEVIDAYISLNYTNEDKESKLNLNDINKSIVIDTADEFTRLVIEFLYLVDFAAYYGKSNIDINKSDIYEFAFKNHSNQFLAYINNYGGKIESQFSCEEKIQNSIFAKDRTISFSEYMTDGFYYEDIKNVKEVLEDVDKEIKQDENLVSLIKSAFEGIFISAYHKIRERYMFILEGAFSVDDYVGIYTGNKANDTFVGLKNRGIYEIEPQYYLGYDYKNAIDTYADCIFSNKRQFDFNEIYNTYTENSASLPIYYPYKILEITQRLKTTTSTLLYMYNDKIKGFNLIESYIDNYLLGFYDEKKKKTSENENKGNENIEYEIVEKKGFFRRNLEDFIIYVCKRLVSDETKLNRLLHREPDDEYENLALQVKNYVDFYVDCVTTAIVLDKFSVSKDNRDKDKLNIDDFRIKFCCKTKNDVVFSNGDFMETLVKIRHSLLSAFKGIEDSNMKIIESMPCVTLGYTANKEKIESMPSFAYKALHSLGDTSLDWKKILLGKDLNDKLVFSSDDDAIKLQKNRLHFIIAGSRSGKGVMCYNIFATAIASKLPFFYIDGKPDTSIVIKNLEPNAFAINHGTHDETIDFEGVLSPSKYHPQYPSYMEDYFGGEDENGIKKRNDFAVFRTILLLMTMIYYCDTYTNFENETMKTTVEKVKDFCKNGLVIVLDEMTKYQEFVQKDLTVEGKGLVSKAKSEKYFEKNYNELMSNLDKVETKIDSNKEKGKDTSKLEKQLNNIKPNMNGLSFYASAFAILYKNLVQTANNKKNASAGLWTKMHIFFIGQSFDEIKMGNSNEAWFKEGAETNTEMFKSSPDISPFINMLFTQPSDVIVGYQPDRQAYMAQEVKGTKSNKLFTKGRRFFAYRALNMSSTNILTIMNTESKVKDLKGYLNNWTFFKPFLILNNAVLPEKEVDKQIVENEFYSKTSKDAEILDMLAKGKSSFSDGSYLRESQYVAQCFQQSIEAGIEPSFIINNNLGDDGEFNDGVGFEGYIRQMSKGNIDDIRKVLSLPTDIVNEFIHNIMGYDGNWEDFVYDFRPQWMFSLNTFDTKTGKLSSCKERLKASYFCSILDNDEFRAMCPEIYEGLEMASMESLNSNNNDEEVYNKRIEDIQDYSAILDSSKEDNISKENNVMPDVTPQSQDGENLNTQEDNEKRINKLLQEEHIPDINDIDDLEETENEEEFESDFDGDFGNVMSGGNEIHEISFNEFKGLTLNFVDKMVSAVCDSLDVMMKPSELATYMIETREKIYNDDTKLSVLIAYCKETYPDLEVNF